MVVQPGLCRTLSETPKTGFLMTWLIWEQLHGVQRRMISVVNYFPFFEIIIFHFVVAICDLVHTVEAMYGLP